MFLGGGRITRALAGGLRLVGDRRRIFVYDRHPEKVRALARESGVEIGRHLKFAVKQAQVLVLAVRPSSVRDLLHEVEGCGAPPGPPWVSLAAGIPLRNLRSWLKEPVQWVRAMPSPVCRIARGLTGVCFDDGVTARNRKMVHEFFAQVGEVIELSESEFDAFTVTYSSSHGYHALATLARAAEAAGLNSSDAFTAAAHALSDGIAYWRESRESLDELLHEAATPGGIAAATMTAMDRAGYARAVGKGLKAGIRRARLNAVR